MLTTLNISPSLDDALFGPGTRWRGRGEILLFDGPVWSTNGVCGVGAVLIGKEGRSLGEHVLLRARIRRRSSIHSAGRLHWAAQRSHGTAVCVQLECSRAGHRRSGTTVAVGCDCRSILATLNYLSITNNVDNLLHFGNLILQIFVLYICYILK